MKNFFYLCIFAVVFAAGCGKDDDDTSGSGGEDGDLTIRLTWDQIDADLDLELNGPDNLSIDLFSNRHSGDDRDGPGDEVITFMDDAEDGDYSVRIEWFNGENDVAYTLVIESAQSGRVFNETINSSIDVDFFSFTKSGGRISF